MTVAFPIDGITQTANFLLNPFVVVDATAVAFAHKTIDQIELFDKTLKDFIENPGIPEEKKSKVQELLLISKQLNIVATALIGKFGRTPSTARELRNGAVRMAHNAATMCLANLFLMGLFSIFSYGATLTQYFSGEILSKFSQGNKA